jgi:hypothetical protein
MSRPPAAKGPCPFRVGQRVRLSREGFTTIRPSTPEECRAAIDGSVILEVGENLTSGEDTFPIELDGPLGIYLISHHDIEAMP